RPDLPGRRRAEAGARRQAGQLAAPRPRRAARGTGSAETREACQGQVTATRFPTHTNSSQEKCTMDALMLGRSHEAQKPSAAPAVAAGEISRPPDGRAAAYTGRNAAAINDPTGWTTRGNFLVTKAASLVFTKGAPVYWDHSANAAVLFPASDRDLYLGACT